jgi:hypothetical protein
MNIPQNETSILWGAAIYIQDITVFFFYCLISPVTKLQDVLHYVYRSYVIPNNTYAHSNDHA